MSDPPKQQQQQPDNDDPEVRESDERRVVSQSPSILRQANPSRQLLSEAPSVVISMPDDYNEYLVEETPEQRHRRRIRFLEMRREHYSQMHQNTEQCTMSEDQEQEQELSDTSPPDEEEEDKRKSV